MSVCKGGRQNLPVASEVFNQITKKLGRAYNRDMSQPFHGIIGQHLNVARVVTILAHVGQCWHMMNILYGQTVVVGLAMVWRARMAIWLQACKQKITLKLQTNTKALNKMTENHHDICPHTHALLGY
jgi:hypothetical protein